MKKKHLILILLLTAVSASYAFVHREKTSQAATDITAPTSTLTLVPSSPDGQNDWYVSPLDITISADDLESGVSSINWKFDSDAYQTQTFSNTLNLVQNPSFEEAGTPLNLWSITNSDGLVTVTKDTTPAPNFDTYSAKIVSTGAGWHGVNDQTYFAVTSSSQNMTSSAWVKTSSVAQTTYYKIYALYDNGGVIQTQLIGTSPTVTGTVGWQKLTYNFNVNVANATGVYIDLGLDGTGTVWFDGVTISSSLVQPSVNFAYSANGTHTFKYYSIDNASNYETEQSTSFKIDTKSPGRWTNFTLTEAGNNHTFNVSIQVTDTTSGLDPSSAQFQYSVDQGATWGYYTDTSGCSTAFVTNGWKDGSLSPNTDGTKTGTFSTGVVDFCNSNWANTKLIRFRIKDMAGNQGTSGDFAINGAWIMVTGGDVYSNDDISMQSNSTVQYFVGARGSISNVSSTSSWFLDNYDAIAFENYDTLYTKYHTTTSLPSGKLPTSSGRYLVNSDFTVDASTIPSGLSTTQNLAVVVFVNGDLNLNSAYSLHNTSGIVFVVKGDITVKNSVSALDGYYITDYFFDFGGGNTQITVNGGIQADTFLLNRSLSGNQNSNNPAEVFVFDPKYLVIGKGVLASNATVTYTGVN